MNQWGVGRKGFDDGLVILFDMQDNRQHGQVSLYAGSGFRAAFLTDAERQGIFDNDMKPRLVDGDFDGALADSPGGHRRRRPRPSTPDQLSRDRILNALVGFGVLALWRSGLSSSSSCAGTPTGATRSTSTTTPS